MYKAILLPMDLNEESSWKHALPTAVELCKAFSATLHVMTVVPNFGPPYVSEFFPEHGEEDLVDKVGQELHEFVAKHITKEIPVQDSVAHGSIYREIITTAERIGADLIVMASHRPQMQDYLVGPNATKVINHSSCTVMVVRGLSDGDL